VQYTIQSEATTHSIRSLWQHIPSPIGVHNLILSHLPPTGKEFLLSMYSRIWSENLVPAAWRETAVIPILKPGKDRFLITSYRHVSLTSCICKTLERVWILESRNLFECSLLVQTLQIHSWPSCDLEALYPVLFPGVQHLVTAFFGLEEAYNTTWQLGIQRTFHQ
jgi:hypothetical protein